MVFCIIGREFFAFTPAKEKQKSQQRTQAEQNPETRVGTADTSKFFLQQQVIPAAGFLNNVEGKSGLSLEAQATWELGHLQMEKK